MNREFAIESLQDEQNQERVCNHCAMTRVMRTNHLTPDTLCPNLTSLRLASNRAIRLRISCLHWPSLAITLELVLILHLDVLAFV